MLCCHTVLLSQGDGKKKKPKFDKEYCLRFSALYLKPLTNDMVAYAERDANGAKAAGGAGLPKFNQRTSAPASSSALYQVWRPAALRTRPCRAVPGAGSSSQSRPHAPRALGALGAHCDHRLTGFEWGGAVAL